MITVKIMERGLTEPDEQLFQNVGERRALFRLRYEDKHLLELGHCIEDEVSKHTLTY